MKHPTVHQLQRVQHGLPEAFSWGFSSEPTYTLALETSCDDTAVAIVRSSSAGVELVAERRASQVDLHTQTGGVVPEVAARAHVESMTPLLRELLCHASLRQSGIDHFNHRHIDVLTVTRGPGLLPSLLVGTMTARALAYAWQKPLQGVHHIEGHMLSILVSETSQERAQTTALAACPFPWLFLVVSGGHTQFVRMDGPGLYTILGRTRDDAAGEAFDKAAKMLGLGYPGGPIIAERAEHGDSSRYHLPRPMLEDDSGAMSFSGLKTSLRVLLEREGFSPLEKKSTVSSVTREQFINDLCAGFQAAVIDVLASKMQLHLQNEHFGAFCLVGGVSANARLRQVVNEACQSLSVPFFAPPMRFCSDHAAMIGAAGLMRWNKDHFCAKPPSWETLQTESRPPLESWAKTKNC